MFHDHSRTPSVSSRASDFSLTSPIPPNMIFDFSGPDHSYPFLHSLQSTSYSAFDLATRKSPTNLEAQQIVKPENSNAIHQLSPEDIFVNGRPLNRKELIVLQSCPSPPKKLKPGNYWYDKHSGFWGKQGQKPTQIITPLLKVGDYLKSDASNGRTEVYINGREISKAELRMLKLAGVRCPRNWYFWVNEDGSYQEEGMRNIQGNLWRKAGLKLICALLSLPFPSKSFYSRGDPLVFDYLEQKAIQKLLLIGCVRSGTSTIFKQAKIVYKEIPFSEDERENGKLLIQRNLYGYIGTLVKGRECFEEECLNELKKKHSYDETGVTGCGDGNDEKTTYSICPRLKILSDWLLNIMESGVLEAVPTSNLAHAPLIDELWSTAAFQETFNRRSELERLPTVASYFLEQAVDILKPDYKPSDMDILYAEGFTSSNGLSYVDFSFTEPPDDDDIDSDDLHDFLQSYQLIRSPVKGYEENLKWLEISEDVGIVIFCVSLIDYDQFFIDSNGNVVNQMRFNRTFFEKIVTHPTFDQIDFLLLLTKFDLFEEKIEQVPLSLCGWFDDFHPPPNHTSSLGQSGFHYIAVKFKKLYSALTGRRLYVSSVNCLEGSSVDAALKYVREILKWKKEEGEYWDYSTDESFYSDEDN
ncbi:Extra-large guanine nucleotide-binding protein 1 [Forsythia ovata]|uniref:Extra-large guanine nucleotide-binding protein 1 n=1 Tax=Forsythia ovata TaxID=205694 RepID=A0ABD1UE68_9LAMI